MIVSPAPAAASAWRIEHGPLLTQPGGARSLGVLTFHVFACADAASASDASTVAQHTGKAPRYGRIARQSSHAASARVSVLPLLGRAEGRRVWAEAIGVAVAERAPAIGVVGAIWFGRERQLQGVEALVPAGAVARRLAELVVGNHAARACSSVSACHTVSGACGRWRSKCSIGRPPPRSRVAQVGCSSLMRVLSDRSFEDGARVRRAARTTAGGRARATRRPRAGPRLGPGRSGAARRSARRRGRRRGARGGAWTRPAGSSVWRARGRRRERIYEMASDSERNRGAPIPDRDLCGIAIPVPSSDDGDGMGRLTTFVLAVGLAATLWLASAAAGHTGPSATAAANP